MELTIPQLEALFSVIDEGVGELFTCSSGYMNETQKNTAERAIKILENAYRQAIKP